VLSHKILDARHRTKGTFIVYHNHIPRPTMASLPQQELSTHQDTPKPSDVSLPSPLAAAKESLYSFSKPSLTAQPNSLNHLMSSRASLKAAHAAFYRDYAKRRTEASVSFENDYGYGKDAEEPPVKRRRMQRRNSKTPAMLMAMSSSLLPLDFLGKKEEHKPMMERKVTQEEDDDDDDLDGGLEIAEELVKHLQTRRSSGFSSSP